MLILYTLDYNSPTNISILSSSLLLLWAAYFALWCVCWLQGRGGSIYYNPIFIIHIIEVVVVVILEVEQQLDYISIIIIIIRCHIKICLHQVVILVQCGDAHHVERKLQIDGIIIIRIQHNVQCAHIVQQHIHE